MIFISLNENFFPMRDIMTISTFEHESKFIDQYTIGPYQIRIYERAGRYTSEALYTYSTLARLSNPSPGNFQALPLPTTILLRTTPWIPGSIVYRNYSTPEKY
jgi:hypothetical protein